MSFLKMFRHPYLEEDNGTNIAGANVGEPAEPQEPDEPNETDKGVNPEPAEPEPEHKTDENAKYAAARREAEKRLKEVESKAQKDKDIAKKYSKEYDVFSEEDIKEKFDMSLDEFENALLQQEYKNAGIDPELINKAITNHPVVKQAETYVNRLQETQRQQWIKEDIENLHKEFPETANVKTEHDLYNLPEWNEINAYIKRGYDMTDAYYKVNKNKLLEKSKKDVEKRTVADIQDRAKRGVVKPDSGDDDTNDVNIDTDMARAFGTDPKKIAKYVKNLTRR
jgi:hypothetical protein